MNHKNFDSLDNSNYLNKFRDVLRNLGMDLDSLHSVDAVVRLLDASSLLDDSSDDYRQVAWLHWHIINRMLNEYRDPNLISQLQFPLLASIEEQWIQEIERDGFTEAVTEGLVVLLERLCRHYHVVS